MIQTLNVLHGAFRAEISASSCLTFLSVTSFEPCLSAMTLIAIHRQHRPPTNNDRQRTEHGAVAGAAPRVRDAQHAGHGEGQRGTGVVSQPVDSIYVFIYLEHGENCGDTFRTPLTINLLDKD